MDFVTVELDNGQVYIGTLIATDTGRLQLNTGLAGRPLVFDPERVEEILDVDSDNPHVSP